MKIQWVILIISAFTDLVITGATSLGTAMLATGAAEIPKNAVLLAALLGGAVAAARTIQQALKATPETTAALKGEPAPKNGG